MSGVTHATIAVAALFGEQENMVLVGHSYAGMIITGVAETMEKSISSFVMLDAFFPETGEAPVDLQPPAVRDGLLAAQRNGGSAIPPRPRHSLRVSRHALIASRMERLNGYTFSRIVVCHLADLTRASRPAPCQGRSVRRSA